MKHLLKILILGILISSGHFQTYSQSKIFSNVLNMNLRNSGAIYQDDQIKGYYYFFTSSETTRNNMSKYVLEILDENLKSIKTQPITLTRNVSLVNGVFNGKEIMLKFFDALNKRIILMRFDNEGKQISKVPMTLDKFEMRYYYNAANLNLNGYSLKPIMDNGFINYSVQTKDRNYQLKFFSSTEGIRNWVYRSKYQDVFAAASFLANSETQIFNLIEKRKRITATKATYAIQGLNLKTGQEEFVINMNSEKFTHQPLKGFYNESTGLLNVIGLYYPPNTNALKDNGLGLFNIQVNRIGEIVKEEYLGWSSHFREFVNVDNSGRISNENKNGYIFFHDIIQAEDGSIIAIGEQYKKSASALGIAAVALGQSAAVAKMVIMDMMVFRFNENFEIEDVRFIEKSKSDFYLPQGYGVMNIHMLSQIINAYGAYDYTFNVRNPNDGAVSITYMDYERKKGDKNEFVFGALTYFEKQFTSDKMGLGRSKGGDWIRVMKAKPGYVLVAEYTRKERSLELRMERINY